jgi:hypothetical protein
MICRATKSPLRNCSDDHETVADILRDDQAGAPKLVDHVAAGREIAVAIFGKIERKGGIARQARFVAHREISTEFASSSKTSA